MYTSCQPYVNKIRLQVHLGKNINPSSTVATPQQKYTNKFQSYYQELKLQSKSVHFILRKQLFTMSDGCIHAFDILGTPSIGQFLFLIR